MTMKIFLLTLVRDAIPDSNSAVVVNTVKKKRYTIVPLKRLFYVNVNFMSKGLYDFAAICLNMGLA